MSVSVPEVVVASSRAQAGEGDGAGPDATSSPVPPIVLVLVEGRPRLLKGAVNAASAVLHSYRPGPAGGLAVAEAVLGSIVPSGRLPFTYPRHSADGVYPYHRKPGDQCTRPTGRHTAAYVPCEVSYTKTYLFRYIYFLQILIIRLAKLILRQCYAAALYEWYLVLMRAGD